MKYLILSLGTGGGHNAAANALKHAFEETGAEANVYDSLRIVSPLRSRLVCGTYLGMAKHLPRLFGILYNFSYHLTGHKHKSIVYSSNAFGICRLENLIRSEQPDCIVTTHVFAAQALSYLKQHRGLSVPTVGVLTDYDVQPFWDETSTDCLFIPTPLLTDGYIKLGVPREVLRTVGIPVEPCLSEVTDKAAAKTEAGLSPRLRHILVMGGSMGAGNIPHTVSALAEHAPSDVQLIAVCGSNRHLMRQLSDMHLPEDRLLVKGFVSPLHTLMRAVDIVITKPGGLSSTEAFEQRIPLIFVHPIEGVERHNFDFFKSQGVALCADTDEDMLRDVHLLLTDPALVSRILSAQRRLVPGGSSREIVRIITEELLPKESP